MAAQRSKWLDVRRPLSARRAFVLKVIAFVVPLAVWCCVSYVPFVWHPMVKVDAPGASTAFRAGDVIARAAYDDEQARLRSANEAAMSGTRANPAFLPAPHEVGRSLYTAFTTPPLRRNAPWLHTRIGQSLAVLFEGFLLACAVALPLGIVCGTFDFFSKLVEPFVDFMRYMPAPAFGALMVAIFGLAEAPKVAIIFIGVSFNLLLVVANATRNVDASLLEAAQTLGASKRKLVTRVVVPGVLPIVYNDLRIALGVAWVYLTIAEIIGEMSGISEFINQQGKYRNYPNVFAGIAILGIIGFLTDQFLGRLGRWLFPWFYRRLPRARRARMSTERMPIERTSLEARPVEAEVPTAEGRIGDVSNARTS